MRSRVSRCVRCNLRLRPSIKNEGLRRFFRKERLDRKDISGGMDQELNEAKGLGLEIRYFKRISPPESINWKPPPPVYTSASGESSMEDHSYFDAPLKRVYVCTPFRGKDFKGNTPDCAVLEQNTRNALWCCHELVRDKKAPVAPFAPQAFYPYFWSFLKPGGQIDNNRWNAWFERSLEVLKICDAVYIYTEEGLPDQSISQGMRTVEKLALSLGIEVQYRKIPPGGGEWKPAVPAFSSFQVDSGRKLSVADAARAISVTQGTLKGYIRSRRIQKNPDGTIDMDKLQRAGFIIRNW